MRKPELPALTGIRFYAALFVFLSHVTLIPGMQAFSGDALLFDAGVVGVSLFFVLSGFVLTYNYSDLFCNGVSMTRYKRFVWDRLTKIYPVHLAMVMVMIPLQIYSPHLPLDWRAVPFHFFLLQCWWPITNPTFYQYLNVPSWSISCEWFFYLLAPATMYLAAGRVRRFLLLTAVAVYITGLGWYLRQSQSEFTRIYLISWFAPSRYIEFLIGVFLARVFVMVRLQKPGQISVIAQAIGIGLLVAGALYRKNSPWPLHGGLLYVPGAVFLIFGLALGRGPFAAHLKTRSLLRLGTASLSFYLVHVPVLRISKGILLKLGWEVHSWTGFCMVVIGMFLFVQSIALAVFRYYESPVQIRLRKMFSQKVALAHVIRPKPNYLAP